MLPSDCSNSCYPAYRFLLFNTCTCATNGVPPPAVWYYCTVQYCVRTEVSYSNYYPKYKSDTVCCKSRSSRKCAWLLCSTLCVYSLTSYSTFRLCCVCLCSTLYCVQVHRSTPVLVLVYYHITYCTTS